MNAPRSSTGRFVKKHGFSYTCLNHKVYQIWTSMRSRCNNPNHRFYHQYGGRGIRVCEAWASFEAFWRDMGPSWREGLTLERRNNDLGYSPDNCIWASRKTQANNRSNSRFVTFAGETKTIAQWAEEKGIPRHRIVCGIKAGRPLEELLQ